MSHSENSLSTRAAKAYAGLIVHHPGKVLLLLAVLGVAATYATTQLTINSNQLDLISQDLQEVKDVKRVIDMVGGAGHLIMAFRGEDLKQLKSVTDDIGEMLEKDKANVRSVTWKLPVEFIQQNMVLFIKTEDLVEGKKRINAYLKDQLRRNNPFFIELKKTEPVKLDLTDLIDKYSRVGKKSIKDDFNLSDDGKVVLMLVKPMWDSNELGRTKDYLAKLTADLAAYSKNNARGVTLEETYIKPLEDGSYPPVPQGKVTYGFTGSYKTTVDDSFAITESLDDVMILALGAIALITMIFFRKLAPTVLVITGTALGTVLTMGFAKITVGQLNMITGILGGILMGFGVDYGIHFIFRTRIELGAGKKYDQAIFDALVYAGRPAFVAAIVTAGSFFVLLVSEFRGFSQFGLLAGFGTIIIGFTLFSWSPAWLALIGRRWPELPAKLIGTMKPPKSVNEGGELRIPRPGLVLSICVAFVALLCAFAIPWSPVELPKDAKPNLVERLRSGVRFNYNTRALVPDDYHSITLQDEVNQRFKISADPIAVYTKDLAGAREVYDEVAKHPEKYPTVDQVVSVFSFEPPHDVAVANRKVLDEWKEELKEIDVAALPPEMQDKAAMFKKILDVQPFTVNELPDNYKEVFRHIKETKPENHGWLTFIYPGIDLWDGKRMIEFADQTTVITTDNGHVYRSAGLPVLYAKLARIVLWDGKLTVLLTTLWILAMHFLDFRSPKLALASVIPLGVGLVMMLGLMSLINERLNFMNIIVLPILLGFGVSHGLYLLHRFLEGTSPVVALRSVGAAVASSTLTAIAGFASLFAASHNGLKSMGLVACLGLTTTLIVSFTVLAAVLQLIHDGRMKAGGKAGTTEGNREAA